MFKRVDIKKTKAGTISRISMVEREDDYTSPYDVPEIAALDRVHPTTVEFTPDFALSVLDHKNNFNRDLKPSKVRRFAERMSRGEWLHGSAHALHFNSEGQLTTGQHRLAAVILSNTTQNFVCFESEIEDIRYTDEDSHSRTDKIQMLDSFSQMEADVMLKLPKYEGILDFERTATSMYRIANYRPKITTESAIEYYNDKAKEAFNLFKSYEENRETKTPIQKLYPPVLIIAITKALLEIDLPEIALTFNDILWNEDADEGTAQGILNFRDYMGRFTSNRNNHYKHQSATLKTARMALLFGELVDRICDDAMEDNTQFLTSLSRSN